MKYMFILGLIGIYAMSGNLAHVPPHDNPVTISTSAPSSSLAQDLNEILHMIHLEPIRGLINRYLLNDEQFQAFVRIINSNDAYITQMRFRSQPEVLCFIAWVRIQIMLSGEEIQFEDFDEFLNIINRTPSWSNTVFGWQGFVNEFLLYYPQDMICAYVQIKSAENGIFSQFLKRLKALKPVYDRIIALPEAQRVTDALQANGINSADLDNFIRNQFGWQHPPTSAPPSTVGMPVLPSAAPLA